MVVHRRLLGSVHQYILPEHVCHEAVFLRSWPRRQFLCRVSSSRHLHSRELHRHRTHREAPCERHSRRVTVNSIFLVPKVELTLPAGPGSRPRSSSAANQRNVSRTDREPDRQSDTSRRRPGGEDFPLKERTMADYSFDLWVNVWRQKWAQGEVVVIRYADDTILGFQYQTDADRFLENLRERLAKFRTGVTPRQDAPDRIRQVCRREPEA